MNKKPNQRSQVKKHKPNVFDDSKQKKILKAQTPCGSTLRLEPPKPVSSYMIQERTQSEKNKSTGSTSNGHEDVVRNVQTASRASTVSVKSCNRSLNFDYHLVDRESHHVSKLHEVLPSLGFSLGESYCYGKMATSNRNTPRMSKIQKKSLKASDDLLGDDNKQQHEQDISVTRNQEQADKNGRKKTNSDTTSHMPTLQVYHRKNQCLQYSKKCGPTFPKMIKKRRTPRRKASVIWWYKGGNRSVSHRNLKKTTMKKAQNKVDKSKDKNGVVNHDLFTKECDLRWFSSPPRRERSIMRPCFKRMPYNNKKYFLYQEKNVLQNKECFPLQEVPIHEIECFTSPHRDFQQFDNSDGNLNWLQLHEVPVLGNQSLVPRHAENPLTKKGMEKLDISGQCSELVVQDDNVSGALVKIVPKKRKVLHKGDLDIETTKIWKVLMDNDGSEPDDETHKDKKEWWERQNDIFCGRGNSFIAKMHLIQGYRRFSPLKGSVIDSVVRVYLTQNVADKTKESTGRVSTRELFFSHYILDGVLCNVARCLPYYLAIVLTLHHRQLFLEGLMRHI